MSKYALPNVVYRGYIVTTDQFTDIMKQIPTYKDVLDNAGYGEHDHIFRYVYWKKLELDKALRSRAPKIKDHWAPGVSTSGLPSHIMILSSYINVKQIELVKDRKLLLERDTERKNIKAIVKFFQNQGVKDLKVEDFEYAYAVGENPKLITT